MVCLEYISRALNYATSNSKFNFHPKCGRLRISYLTFTDDLMLMACGDLISVEILMKCLKDFGFMLGSKANVLKSNIFTVGIQSQDLGVILAISGFYHGNMSFRYLGIPLVVEKLKVRCYAR